MRSVVVLPEPLGPRKPVIWPCFDLQRDVLDDAPVAEALVEPADVDREGHGSGSTSTGRPGFSSVRIGRIGFDHEHQPVAAVAAEDDRRRELGLRADVADAGGEPARAAVAGKADRLARPVARDRFLGHEEAHLDLVVGDQADDGLVGRDPFAGLEIDLPNAAGGRRHRRQLADLDVDAALAAAGLRVCARAWRDFGAAGVGGLLRCGNVGIGFAKCRAGCIDILVGDGRGIVALDRFKPCEVASRPLGRRGIRGHIRLCLAEIGLSGGDLGLACAGHWPRPARPAPRASPDRC